ncbi:MAG: MBL fold metallo-hydrolase [Proteobacteria bacterium]|nr:MBL fold metallo-hydrolase [Pseudomonadota bacterium]
MARNSGGEFAVLATSFGVLACSCTVTGDRLDTGIAWERLRPLDNNPELDSGEMLNRRCVPGETVVVRSATGADSAGGLALRQGQFVVCIGNSSDGALTVVDGPGNLWSLRRDQVNATRGFPANWGAHDRDYLVWAYSRDTLIFREILRNSYEGNFFYLLLDTELDGSIARGMLIDSGTGFSDLRPYVEPVIQDSSLIVVSTHSHWDHFGGHRHFFGMSNVELVGYRPQADYNPYPQPPEYDLEGLMLFFGIGNWPLESATYTLGNRNVEILPVPGHTSDSIAFYDHQEQLLFTGDTIYPGLLFIESWPDYSESLAKLDEFTRQHPVKWHVEMSTRRTFNGQHEYFYFGSNTHWQEHSPNMPATYAGIARMIVNDALESAPLGTPHYDARIIDRQFHSMPLVPVPFPGIPSYYRVNAERLVNQLIDRHRLHDRIRERR